MISLVLVVLAAPPEDAPFKFVEEVGDIRVEARPREGSDFSELRLSTVTNVTVDALCTAAFGDGSIPPGDPYVRERRVLREVSRDERIMYDRVVPPLVSERDYAVRVKRERGQTNCVVKFDLANEAAPPPVADRVRLPRLTITWRFEKNAEGKTTVVYTAHSEPGGSVTAFISEGPRRKTEIDVVRRTLKRASGI
ncbi:MAG: hypothetical protein QM817_31250 [Archangium sp.]